MSSTHVLHACHADLYIKNVWGVYFFKMYTYVSETKDEEMMLGCCVFVIYLLVNVACVIHAGV